MRRHVCYSGNGLLLTVQDRTKCLEIHNNFLKNWAILCLFFVYFRLFKQSLQFLQQINVKNVMTIQHTALGFEPTTFGT